MGAINKHTLTFSSSANSSEFDLGKEVVIGLELPASFGQTSITFQAKAADGTSFLDVHDSSDAIITVTVDGSNAGFYDLTSVFPAGVRRGRLSTGGSVSAIVVLVSRDV